MLKRLWIVLSVIWTLLCILLTVSADPRDPLNMPAIVLFTALPWMLGPVLLLTVRYVIRGSFAAPPPPTSEREIGYERRVNAPDHFRR